MSAGSSTEILVLSNIQAKELAGSLLGIGGEVLRLKDYDPAYPGQPPWRSGAEGKAYPLLGRDGSVVAYLKFFTRPTQKRLNRTAWLIGQQMHTWLPGLAAAPLFWIDTRLSPGSAGIGFNFAGYVAQAVPGETWLEIKNRMVEAGASLPGDFRWRCVADLVLATAVLERAGMIHGDLSPNNIIVDLHAPLDQPALYLIDFDAFVAPAAGPDQAVDVAEGGTYGTEGYCPPDLSARVAAGDGSAMPYSDCYGRDMLILEMLLMDSSLSPDDPPEKWNRESLLRLYAAWQATCDLPRRQALTHLEAPGVFSLSEQQRPSSMQLAADLGLVLPESPVIYTDAQLAHSPSPLPGIYSVSAHVQQRPRRRRTPSPVRKQSRRAAPSQAPSLSPWLVSAQVVPRRLRRVQSTGLSRAQKNDLRFLVLVIIAAYVLVLLIFLVQSCHKTPTIGRLCRYAQCDHRRRTTELLDLPEPLHKTS